MTVRLDITSFGLPSARMVPASMQTRRSDDLEQDVDNMFDPDNGDVALAQGLDCVDQFGSFGIGQTATNLVQQQDDRIGGDGTCQFQALPVQEPERFGAPISDLQHAAKLQRVDAAVISLIARNPPPFAAATKRFSKTVIPPKGRGI